MAISARNFIDNVELLCAKSLIQEEKSKALARLSPSLKKKRKGETFGYRQLNEVLLLLNERIVTREFFSFLAGGSSGTTPERDAMRFDEFKSRIEDFRKLAMLEFGSFRFAYNSLSGKSDVRLFFERWLRKPGNLVNAHRSRKKAFCDMVKIPPKKLYLLGYVSGEHADDIHKDKFRRQGKQNFDTYLTWDHLDVYVATSMRTKWEYADVHSLCAAVFGTRLLQGIKVRHFDPTLNYHEDSIAKGLIEGLMLRRAKCTLYLAQESDTMGKDSEMAATLAQGKPVVSYIPKIDPVKRCRELSTKPLEEVLERAEFVAKKVPPDKAEEFNRARQLLTSAQTESRSGTELKRRTRKLRSEFSRLLQVVALCEKEFFDKRAETLMHKHPLRFQIHLETGVANGVLVARSVQQCAKVIYGLLTNSLQFDIVEDEHGWNHMLVEKSTKSAFRVVTKDEKLTNSFWNLYKRGEI